MIIATITVIMMLMNGGIGFSFDIFNVGVEEVVKDKDRAKQVISITKEADKEVKALSKDLNKMSKELIELNSDYDLTRDDMDKFYEKNDKRRIAFQEKIIKLRFKAKDLMSENEWNAAYAKSMEALKE
jgi:DNA integrity scanning protein DisA with diadenylate cyclase activity